MRGDAITSREVVCFHNLFVLTDVEHELILGFDSGDNIEYRFDRVSRLIKAGF